MRIHDYEALRNHAKLSAREAFVKWTPSLQAPWWLTLNSNRNTTETRLRRDIGQFLAAVDRDCLGNRFRHKLDQRTFFIGWLEDGTYWHSHGSARFPDKFDSWGETRLTTHLTEIWKSVIPSGTLHLKLIVRSEDQERVAAYSTKRRRHIEFEDRLILSTEFWSKRA